MSTATTRLWLPFLTVFIAIALCVAPADGYALHGEFFAPGRARGATVIIAPAIFVRQRFYLAFAAHLAERGFFVEIDHPKAGKLKYPGAPCKFSSPLWQLKRPAPLLGQHNEEVFCQRLGYTRKELVKLRQAGVI